MPREPHDTPNEGKGTGGGRFGAYRTERVNAEEGRRLLAKSQGTQPETKIKAQVRDWLRYEGWFVRWNLQGLGCYPGMPDMIVTRDGRTVEIEVKTPRGKQSARQLEYEDALTLAGGEYRVVRCVEDVMDLGRGK
jgi:hypothetical protein